MNRFAVAYFHETKGLGVRVVSTELSDEKAIISDFLAGNGWGGMDVTVRVAPIDKIEEAIGQRALANKIQEEGMGQQHSLESAGLSSGSAEPPPNDPTTPATKPPPADFGAFTKVGSNTGI